MAKVRTYGMHVKLVGESWERCRSASIFNVTPESFSFILRDGRVPVVRATLTNYPSWVLVDIHS